MAGHQSKKEDRTDLTVVIVNWNTRDLLKDCLYSILGNADSEIVKAIVVDNASTDGSGDMVSTLFPSVQLINAGDNIGFGRANNLAIPMADTPFILFLNPDTLVMENSIQSMVAFMKNDPSVGALSCKIINRPPKEDMVISPREEPQALGLQWFPSPFTELLTNLFLSHKVIRRLKKYLPYQDPNQSGYVTKLYGACLMVRSEVLRHVGSFDERFFMYCEDVDLSKRIADSGWKLYYLSEAEILHLSGAASEKASNNFASLMMSESVSKLMEKYYGNKGKLLYKIVVLGGSCARLLFLFVLKMISRFCSIGRDLSYDQAFKKYIVMMKWSLNLEKPVIKKCNQRNQMEA